MLIIYFNLFITVSELNFKDPKIAYKVDISLPKVIQTRSKTLSEKLLHIKQLRNDQTMEKLAREKNCKYFVKIINTFFKSVFISL